MSFLMMSSSTEVLTTWTAWLEWTMRGMRPRNITQQNQLRRRLIVKYKEEEKRLDEEREKYRPSMRRFGGAGVSISKKERLAMYERWDRDENIQIRIQFLQSEIVK